MVERCPKPVMKAAPPESPGKTPGLHRSLGLGEVTASGVGIIIGAGIYVLLGAATAHAGATVWLAFVLAAVLSALTGLSYAELASMYPSAAAEYEYTRQALPEWIAFVVGWVMVAGLVVAAATVSLGFARYAGYFFDLGIRPAALALIAGLALLAMIGIKQSARVTVVLSAVQVGGLVIVIVIGAPHVGEVNLLAGPGVGGILSGAALVFFAFIGFDEVITLAEETRDPTRTVPRALLLALGISTVLYIAVAMAAVSVLGAGALGASQRPLTDVMAHAPGEPKRRPRLGDRRALDREYDPARLDGGVAPPLRHGHRPGAAGMARRRPPDDAHADPRHRGRSGRGVAVRVDRRSHGGRRRHGLRGLCRVPRGERGCDSPPLDQAGLIPAIRRPVERARDPDSAGPRSRLGARDADPAGGPGGLGGPRGMRGRRDCGVPAAIRETLSGRVRAHQPMGQEQELCRRPRRILRAGGHWLGQAKDRATP